MGDELVLEGVDQVLEDRQRADARFFGRRFGFEEQVCQRLGQVRARHDLETAQDFVVVLHRRRLRVVGRHAHLVGRHRQQSQFHTTTNRVNNGA